MENLNISKFTFQAGFHRNKNIIWIRFPKNFVLLNELKKMTRPIWSQSNKCWYVIDSMENRTLFQMKVKIVGFGNDERIRPINLPELQKFHENLILKGYSKSTIKTYAAEFSQLLYLLKNHPVKEMTTEKLRSYLLYCHKDLKISENQIHSRMNALKFYFEKVLHRDPIFFDIPRPKKQQQLPKALNQEEIKRIIEVTENNKHKLVIKLCYGMGLRVSEIVNLKIQDFDVQKKRVLIERAKGKKDRYVNLPQSVLPELRAYYKEYKPKKFLFEGQDGGQYSIRSAQNIFKTGMLKAGIYKKVGIHTLRHSYATHLLEFGTDISLIQKLLGHNNIKTTLVYTNVTGRFMNNVVSPLDRIEQ